MKLNSYVPYFFSEDVDETLYLYLAVDPKLRMTISRSAVLLRGIYKIPGRWKVLNEDEALGRAEKRKELQEKRRAAAAGKQKEKGEKSKGRNRRRKRMKG
ncbi:hypothetical protein BPAE_0100g00140 [Botrytis paeoniae]|uniref:Uncharacterized protein n=1 Tax=Botrytis paeoniae TaxID=278948 RepID=A0A4Z1FIQ4_9HELO|nr:hypothetical protein BPAE_0100g00140 [Botrytis paeoniae]